MSKFVLTAQLQLQAPTNTQQVINQIRGQLQGAINIPVNVQGSVQAAKQINQVNQAAQKATTAGERMGKAFGASIKRFAAFNIATRAVGLFASKLSQAVDESIKFQRELIKISQVTGKTTRELQGLTDTITNLSTSLGTSSTSLLQTGRILAQAGIQAGDLKVALEALAKTTLAPTFDDITETAEGAVAILAQFGEGVGALEKQLGAINAVAGQFAVESGDLISVVRRTGGVFRQAGGDLNELLALFTSVRATTRENSESIATGLRTIFTRIQRPQTIEYLKQFGVQLTDLNGRFVGPYEAVRQLSAALAGLEQGDIRFVQIAEELGGFRQIGKVIPLIQKFEVAERARQAAIAGGNSLTKDAETAQEALAVQIEKTRERFLALIRSISETSTFQIMIKSLLGIANAFIKVAESIKPLIPLITAFAAVKLTRGLGTFVSGIGAGLRGKNQGGKIHAFARGGTVPGTGNRDTVPAMLTPGEFVIRKSSVNKIGTDTLAAMNENKYAKGGQIKINPGAIGGFFLRPEQGDPRNLPVNETVTLTGPKALQALGHVQKNKNIARRDALLSADKATQAILLFGRKGLRQGKVLKKKLTDKDFTTGSNPTLRSANKSDFGPQAFSALADPKVQQRIDRNIARGNISGGSLTVPINGSITGFFPGGDDLKKNAKVARIVRDRTAKGLSNAVKESAGPINKILDVLPTIDFNEDQVKQAARRISKDANAATTTQGFIFEGIIQGITGARLAGGQSNFDFPSSSISSSRPALQSLFSSGDEGISRLIKADAKRSNTSDAKKSIVNKIKNDVNKGLLEGLSFVKKASGGGISGSDTVPAMLTPGEFVVNKKAAQSIGYGNLNRMNKQGVVGYAKGGPVQYFKNGTSGAGVQGGGGADAFFKLSALQTVAGLAAEKLDKMTKNADGTSSAVGRVGNELLSMITTISSVMFALQMFGVTLNAQSIGNMFNMLGGKIKGLRAGLGNFAQRISRPGSGVGRVLNSPISQLGPVQNFRSGLSVGRGATFGLQNAGFANKAGRFVGGAGKLASRIPGAGLVRGGARLVGRAGGMIAGGLGGAAGSIAAMAGPITLAVGGLALFSKALSAAFGYQEEYNKAIEEGNAAKAEELAVLSQSTGLTQLGDKIGELFGSKKGAFADVVTDFSAFFGFSDTSDSLKATAKASALAGKYNKQLAINSKAAAEKLKDVESGAITLEQAFASGALTANLRRAQEAEKAAREASDANEGNKTTGFWSSIGRDVSRGFGLWGETTVARNKRIDEENNKRNKEAKARTQKEFEALLPQINSRAREQLITTGGTGTFDDFLATLPEDLRKQIEKEGRGKIEEAYENQRKAILENIKYLQALNFGLKEVNAQATVTSSNMERLVASQESGFNAFTQSLGILEQSLTSAATSMDPTEIQKSQQTLADTLRAYGADQKQIDEATGAMDGFYKAQIVASAALNDLKGDISKNTAPEALKEAFKKNIGDKLAQQGVDKSVIERVQNVLGGLKITEKMREEIAGGNFSGVLAALEPLGKEMSEQVLGPLKELAKQNDILTDLTKKRIQLEQQANEAKKKAIDIELEAAQAIADFGGRAVTSADKVSFANRKLNIDLAAAGVRGVGGGSANELAAVQQNILADFNALQNEANVAAARGTGAFQGPEGAERDKRPQLEAAQQQLIDYTRQRIALVKEELDIVKRKNELEKNALDKLLSGDIEGFFQDQAAAGAASALRTGNQALIGSFSASAIGAGFKNLQGQNLPPQQMERIASGALRSLGIQDRRSAQIFAGNTAEEQRLMSEGQQLAGILGAAGQGLAGMSEMAVQANNVVIKTTKLQMGAAANVQAPAFSKGGIIYANRGIFVPRGTDTVPAMLTPGEFVVNRAAVQRGNNLAILQAMNNGQQASGPAMASGGQVQYRMWGGMIDAISKTFESAMPNLQNIFSGFTEAVGKLTGMDLNVKLDPTNVNVNFNGTSFLSNLTDNIRKEVLAEVKRQIPNIKHSKAGDGNHVFDESGM